MQILIMGMHRSGTSATARLVNLMGAYFGPEGSDPGVTIANPKGYWERTDIFMLNDSLLEAKNCSWDNLKHIFDSDITKVPPAISGSIHKLVLGMDAFRPWFIKDPRMCLTLPAWRPYLEVPIAVIAHRDPLEVAQSLNTRDGFPIGYGLALWEAYTVQMLNVTRDIPRHFVDHALLVRHPLHVVQSLFDWLVSQETRRLSMPSQREIMAFIDQRLYRSKIRPGAGILSASQMALAETASGRAPQTGLLFISEESLAILRGGPPKTDR